MFPRIAKKKYGKKTYRTLQILQSYRDGEGRVRQRLVANLGDPGGYSPTDVRNVIQGLRRVFGLETEVTEAEGPTTTRSLGGAHVVFHLWEKLGWTRVIRSALRQDRFRFDILANVKALVAHRLLDPGSKLSVLDWLESVYLPGVPADQITYNHLLRAMDFLERHKDRLELGFAAAWRDLYADDVDVVFYDLTSAYFQIEEADPEETEDDASEVSTLRRYGYSRDHRPDLPQVVMGLVMSRSGMPLAHHVFPGNTVDKTTVQEVSRDLRKRFRIRRCVFVGDRGLMTEENREALRADGFEFILAHPLRNNNDVKETLDRVEASLKDRIDRERSRAAEAKEPMAEVLAEVRWGDRRFVVAHSEEIAVQTKKTRTRKLTETEALCKELAGKLDRQDGGESFRGKKLTDQGALLKVHDQLRDDGLLRLTKVYLNEDGGLAWEPDEEARRWENRIDGKLVLETSNVELSAEDVVARYRDRQEIERCFRTVKSSLDLRPMFHRVDRRIRAHAFLCVMALQIDRWMRMKLRASGIPMMPARALDKLSRIIALQIEDGGASRKAVTTPSPEQLTLFKALEVPKPNHNDFAFESGL